MNRLILPQTVWRLAVKRERRRFMLCAVACAALLFIAAATVAAQNNASVSAPLNGSLSELADKHRVLLLVKRSSIVDARGGQSALIEEALQPDTHTVRRYRLAFNAIARKLNKFLKKRRNLSAVERVEDADFIVFFNLLEYRWPLGTPYPYGELFVIIKPESGAKARVVWKTKKVKWAGDAADDLMDDLRLIQWDK